MGYIRVDLLEKGDAALLNDLNYHLQASLEVDYANHNYDLLYGLVGKGLCFLERLPDPSSKVVLKHLVDQLAGFSVKGDAGFTWYDPAAASDNTYSLGMVHGIPSG